MGVIDPIHRASYGSLPTSKFLFAVTIAIGCGLGTAGETSGAPGQTDIDSLPSAESSPKPSPAGGKGPSRRPNVLFLVVDDLRPELACYGKEYIHSPNIDRLASSGLLFTHAYCQQATCNASRASFMLGMRPDSTRVSTNRQHFRDTVGREVVTLAEHFKNHQYASVGLGKVFHSRLNDERSWSHFDHCVTRRVRFRPKNQSPVSEQVASVAEPKSGKAAAHLASVPPYECIDAPDDQYSDGLLTDEAIRQLGRLKDLPFFLAVGYHKPHLPFNAPKKYWDLYDPQEIQPSGITDWPQGAPKHARTRSNELRFYEGMPKKGNVTREQAIRLIHGYRACVSFVDAGIGRILDELERLELANDTIVVLCGDHGFKLGKYSAWSKHTSYEIDTRVPLLIRVPGMFHRGARSSALVELIDIYPTLCELAELPLPAQLEGRSFVPLVERPDRAWKQAALSQFPRGRSGTRQGDLMGYAMRTRTHLFVRWVVRDGSSTPRTIASELYDQRKDPEQTVNIAIDPTRAELVAQMETQFATAYGWGGGDPLDDRRTQPFASAALRTAGFLFLAIGAVGCVYIERTSTGIDRVDSSSKPRWMPGSWLLSVPKVLTEEGRKVRGRCLRWLFPTVALLLLGGALVGVSL